MSDDERAIRDLVAKWLAASKEGDLATVLTLMSDDVVFMVPGGAPFGKDEFAAGSRAMRGVQIDGTSDIQELVILGDWAWMRNRLRVTMTPPGNQPVVRSGYTLTILRKEHGGRWVIVRDANLLAPETNS
jgi:uncharacterized protein (TIGR02246 family)